MRSGIRRRVLSLMMVFSCGGAMLQVTSCSPGVRDTILQGLETTSTTFATILVQALFDGLRDGN